MIGEPTRTQYDWHFRIFDFPVRVHPFFWLLSALLGRSLSPRGLFIWIAVLFVSILVHELGHAIAIRYFGANARIVLYSFGGLAITESKYGNPVRRTAQQQVLISLAGPIAGFLLAGLVTTALFATNHVFYFDFSSYNDAGQVLREFVIPFGRRGANQIQNDSLRMAVSSLLYVNTFWGLFNLLPIYPLDGGQVSRQLFVVNSNDGVRSSLQLSLGTAAVLAGLALFKGEPYIALMLGYMAYMNYQQLSAGGFGGFGNRSW